MSSDIPAPESDSVLNTDEDKKAFEEGLQESESSVSHDKEAVHVFAGFDQTAEKCLAEFLRKEGLADPLFTTRGILIMEGVKHAHVSAYKYPKGSTALHSGWKLERGYTPGHPYGQLVMVFASSALTDRCDELAKIVRDSNAYNQYCIPLSVCMSLSQLQQKSLPLMNTPVLLTDEVITRC